MPSSRSPSRPARPRPHPRRRRRGRARARGVGGPDRSRRRTQGCACAWGCVQDSAPRSSLRPKLRLRVGPIAAIRSNLRRFLDNPFVQKPPFCLLLPSFPLQVQPFEHFFPNEPRFEAVFVQKPAKVAAGATPGPPGSAARANRHGLIVPEGCRSGGRRRLAVSCATVLQRHSRRANLLAPLGFTSPNYSQSRCICNCGVVVF